MKSYTKKYSEKKKSRAEIKSLPDTGWKEFFECHADMNLNVFQQGLQWFLENL